jgi:hypothetical protein
VERKRRLRRRWWQRLSAGPDCRGGFGGRGGGSCGNYAPGNTYDLLADVTSSSVAAGGAGVTASSSGNNPKGGQGAIILYYYAPF